MPTQIPLLYASNTFGELIKTVDILINSVNEINYSDWVKSNGALVFSGDTGFSIISNSGIIVNSDSKIGANLIVSGLISNGTPAPTINIIDNTITPNAPIVFVDGSGIVSNITPPPFIQTNGGQILLIPTSNNWSANNLGVDGNISANVRAVTNVAMMMSYDTTTSKWYPGYFDNQPNKDIIITMLIDSYNAANIAWSQANIAYHTANIIWHQSNTGGGNTPVIDAYFTANIAWNQANIIWSETNTVYDTANTIWNQSNIVWAETNTVYDTANTIWNQSNIVWAETNTAYNTANIVWNQSNIVWAEANAAYDTANLALAQANSASINTASIKITPVDNDYIGIIDSAAANTIKKLSWSNIKSTLKSYFDTIYAPYTPPYRNVSSNTRTVLSDSNGGLIHPGTDTTSRNWIIESNANVAYPIFTSLNFINRANAGAISISIALDTLEFVNGTTGGYGTRTLASNSSAVALKVDNTAWVIYGSGLT